MRSHYRRYRRRYGGYRRGYSRNTDPVAGLIAIGIIALGWLVVKNPQIIFWAALGLLLFWLYRRYKRSNLKLTQTSEDTNQINEERQTAREYYAGTNYGERDVAIVLAQGLNYKEYFVYNNVTIPSQHNGSSQIDHIIISKFGIFVIETKDYKGWIFGGTNQAEWTQSLPGGNNKFQFQNPIRQNWSHIQSLRELFPLLSKDKFVSIVVFTDASEFKTPMPENVINIGDLVKSVVKYQTAIIDEEMIYTILGKLAFVTQTSNITVSEHLQNLNNHHQD